MVGFTEYRPLPGYPATKHLTRPPGGHGRPPAQLLRPYLARASLACSMAWHVLTHAQTTKRATAAAWREVRPTRSADGVRNVRCGRLSPDNHA
jgi:hypothetical protein